MSKFKSISIPVEDYEAWGASPDSVIQSYLDERGDLVLHIVTDEDMEEFICDGGCESCPLADSDCDGECLSCPCYANCDDSDYTLPEGMRKSHGNRRDEF